MIELNCTKNKLICIRCCQSHGKFCFEQAQARLAKSASLGIEKLKIAVSREKILMRTACSFDSIKIPENVEFSKDITAAEIIRRVGSTKSNTRMPVSVKGDGNCLFNAISVAVCGDETRSVEIKARTTIELVDQWDWYITHNADTRLHLASPDFEEACLNCALPREYSSGWTMHAASSVVSREIISVYPAINGLFDKCMSILNRAFLPRCEVRQDPIYIMWSGNLKLGEQIWTPNHFVPLMLLPPLGHISIDSTPLLNTIASTPQSLGRSTSSAQIVYTSTPIGNYSMPCVSKIYYDTEETGPVLKKQKLLNDIEIENSGKLHNGRFLLAEEIYWHLQEKRNVFKEIPRGVKEDILCG